MIYYVYSEPPTFDEKLYANALSMLTWAPLLFLSFGYWMLSSKSLLENSQIHSYTYLNDENIYSGHIWTEVFTKAVYGSDKPSMPLLLLFWILLILTFFKNTLIKVWNFFPFLAIADFEIDQKLGNYFECLDETARTWSLEEEKYYRKNLGLSVLTPYQRYKLEDAKQNENVIKSGAHSYDILVNEEYAEQFQYFSPSMGEKRSQYIKDGDDDDENNMMQSDLVKIILNLHYFPISLA